MMSPFNMIPGVFMMRGPGLALHYGQEWCFGTLLIRRASLSPLQAALRRAVGTAPGWVPWWVQTEGGSGAVPALWWRAAGVPWFLSLGLSVCATPSEQVWMGSMPGCMDQDSAWWPASKGGDKISNSGWFMPEFWPRPFTYRRSDLLYLLVLFQKPGYWVKRTCYLFFLF